MRIEDATISDLLVEVRKRTGLGFGGRSAKKLRKEVRKLQEELAQESSVRTWTSMSGLVGFVIYNSSE